MKSVFFLLICFLLIWEVDKGNQLYQIAFDRLIKNRSQEMYQIDTILYFSDLNDLEIRSDSIYLNKIEESEICNYYNKGHLLLKFYPKIIKEDTIEIRINEFELFEEGDECIDRVAGINNFYFKPNREKPELIDVLSISID